MNSFKSPTRVADTGINGGEDAARLPPLKRASTPVRDPSSPTPQAAQFTTEMSRKRSTVHKISFKLKRGALHLDCLTTKEPKLNRPVVYAAHSLVAMLSLSLLAFSFAGPLPNATDIRATWKFIQDGVELIL